MSRIDSYSGSETELSLFEQLQTGVSNSANGYIAHTTEYVVCESVALGMSNSSSSGEKEYCCNICSTKKPTFNEIKSHMFNHIGAIPYFCVVCNFSDISLTQLFLHLLSHKEFVIDPEKVIKLKEIFKRMVYTCNLCLFSFKSSKDLTTHYIQHITNSFKCKSCKFVFFTDTELLIHTHYHSLNLFCRVCDKRFSSNQKAFLMHVLSHDYTRLYRNFPKVKLSHQKVPFYESFFQICHKVNNVDLPMYCCILKRQQQRRKKTVSSEVNQPVSINHSSCDGTLNGMHSNPFNEDVKPDISKIPFFGSTSSNEISPTKVSLFRDEGLENQVNSGNQLTSNISPCWADENIKSPTETPLILEKWSQKDCSNDFSNITDICQEVKVEEHSSDGSVNENCITNNASNVVAGLHFSKLITYPTESMQMQSISQNYSASNENVEELYHLDGRMLKVVLDRLPEDILTVEADTDSNDHSELSPKFGPGSCFKYLSIVLHKLPDYVNDFDSFKKYEKELSERTFPATPPDDKSIRENAVLLSMENLSLLAKNSGKHIDGTKNIEEFSSFHNLDSTASEESLPLNFPLTRKRTKSPKKHTLKKTQFNNRKKARILSPILTHETCTNSLDGIPENREGNDLKTDTASLDRYCMCCDKIECVCIDLDVGEDINSTRNRIQSFKLALESIEKNYSNGLKG